MNTQDGVTDTAPNEVTDEGSGNLSLADLTQRFLPQSEEGESDDETTASAEEETLDTDENTDVDVETEEETEDADEQPDNSDDEEEANEQLDVLSKYNLDLESLSDDEKKELNKLLGGSMYKRVNKLTAKYKALADELEEAKGTPKQDKAPVGLESATTIEALDTEAETLNQTLDWVSETLDDWDEFEGDNVHYDEDGNKFIKIGQEQYDKKQLKLIKRNTENTIKKGIPQRRKWIEEKAIADQQAGQLFEWYSDPESSEFQLYEQAMADPAYAPILTMPNASFLMGVAIEGIKALQAKQPQTPKGKGKVATTKKPKAPPAPAGAAVSKSKTTTNKQKAIAAAYKTYESTGSADAYATYLKLKNS